MLDLAHQKHHLANDVLKVMFTNVLPVRTNAVKADLTEIAAGNGYPAGGLVAAFVSDGQVNGLYKLVIAKPLLSASGGDIEPFQYGVLYNSTPSAGPLIGWFGYPDVVTVHAVETFLVEFNQDNGVFQLGG